MRIEKLPALALAAALAVSGAEGRSRALPEVAPNNSLVTEVISGTTLNLNAILGDLERIGAGISWTLPDGTNCRSNPGVILCDPAISKRESRHGKRESGRIDTIILQQPVNSPTTLTTETHFDNGPSVVCDWEKELDLQSALKTQGDKIEYMERTDLGHISLQARRDCSELLARTGEITNAFFKSKETNVN